MIFGDGDFERWLGLDEVMWRGWGPSWWEWCPHKWRHQRACSLSLLLPPCMGACRHTRTRTHTCHVSTVRRQPSMDQEENFHKRPATLAPWSRDVQPPELWGYVSAVYAHSRWHAVRAAKAARQWSWRPCNPALHRSFLRNTCCSLSLVFQMPFLSSPSAKLLIRDVDFIHFCGKRNEWNTFVFYRRKSRWPIGCVTRVCILTPGSQGTSEVKQPLSVPEPCPLQGQEGSFQYTRSQPLGLWTF